MAQPAAVLQILVNAQTRQAQTELRRMDRTVGDSARNASKATKEVDKLQAGVRKLGDQSSRSTRGLGLLKRNIAETVVGFRDLDRGVSKTNQSFTLFRNAVATLKWPAIIAGAGAAAQALAAAGAAAAALVGALAPLTGLLVAYPALLGAVGQALGVVSLAFKNVGEAMDGNKEAMKRLTDQQRAFVKEIKGLKPELDALKDAAGADLFGGLTQGLRDAIENLPVLRGVARRTGGAIGDLAAQAGKLVGSKGFGRDFQTVGNLNIRVISRLGEGAINLGNALRQVVVAAGPFIDWLSRTVLGFTQSAESAAKLGRESGSLGRFFQSTREVLRVVAPMAWDFGQALLNIARAGRPLGMDILRSLREGAEAFREWTESAAGQNALRDYFARARPVIFEVGRLIRDVTQAFFRLGAQPGFAKVVKQIRTELLPVIERVIASTNKALTPALVSFATAAARAFEPLIGAYGPVVLLIKGLTSFLNVIANLTQNSTLFASAMQNVFGLFAAFKLAKLFAIATGLRAVRNALLGVTAAGGAAAAAGGGAAGGGILAGILKTFRGGAAAGGVLGGLTALFNKVKGGLGRAGAIGLGVAVGSVVLSGIQQRIRDRGRQTLQQALEQVSRQAEGGSIGGKLIESIFGESDVSKRARTVIDAIEEIRKSARGIDSSKATELRGEIRKLSGVSDTARESLVGFVNRAEKRMEDLGTRFRKTGRVSDQFADNLRGLRIRGNKDFDALVENVTFGSRQILRIGGRNSKATREEVAKQFDLARQRVQDAMDRSVISTQEGTARLRELAKKELGLYGISAGRVNVVLAKGPSGEMRPHQRGGFIDEGRPSGDSVPAMLEKDEYVLNRRAVKKVGKRALDALNFSEAPRFGAAKFQMGGLATGLKPAALSIARWAGNRYDARITSGLRPGDAGSWHATGHAVDLVSQNMVAMARGIDRAFRPRLEELIHTPLGYSISSGQKVAPYAVADHYDHVHAAALGRALAAITGAARQLPKVSLQGPQSFQLEAGQGVLDRVRQAAQRRLDQVAGTQFSSADPSLAGVSGTNIQMGRQLARRFGWTGAQWRALRELWTRESGWSETARNPSSGAYGIPQALPPGKMGGAAQGSGPGAARAQIHWGLRYIRDRYGSPRAALNFHDSHNWYQRGGLVGMQGGGATIVNQGVRGPAESLTTAGSGQLARQLYRTLRTIRKSDKPKIRSKALQGLLKRIKGIDIPRVDKIAELQAKTSMFGEFADRASQLSFGLDPSEYQDLPVEALRGLAAGHLAQMTDRQRGLVEFSGRSLEQLDEDALRELLDFPVWAQVGGKTQVEWLEAQLETMRVLRNALIRADELIVARRQAVMERIREMQERLEAVADAIRRWGRIRNRLENALEKARDLSGPKAPERAREIVNRLRGDIPDNIWHALHRAVGKERPTLELRKELRDQIGNIADAQGVRVRERDALQDRIIPALVERRGALTEALSGADGVRPALDEIQGQVGDDIRTQIFDQLPELGVLGGNIFDVQMSLRELGVRKILSVPQPEVGEAAEVAESESAELLRQLLREANLRTAVSEAQFQVLRNMPPYGGSFAEGGVVPGPVGAPRTVIAHGGEAIGQPGDVTVNVNVAPGMEWLKRFIDVRVEHGTRRGARNAGRGLPGRGGGF